MQTNTGILEISMEGSQWPHMIQLSHHTVNIQRRNQRVTEAPESHAYRGTNHTCQGMGATVI